MKALASVGDFGHAVVTWVDRDGYPFSVATTMTEPNARVLRLAPPEPGVPEGARVNAIFSHIRAVRGIGYDQRRYVSFVGTVRHARDVVEVEPVRTYGWDERKTPFVQYSELGVPRGLAYLRDLSARVEREVRPRLSRGWLFLRATRLPFVSATAVAVFLGVAVAARDGAFHLPSALATLVGAVFIHLGLNIANDVFDTLSGADLANTTPTQFSGGSRVVQYGLMQMGTLVALSAGFYLAGIGIGVALALWRESWMLFWIGVAGVGISLAYTAPPFRLVHHGLGEVAVAAGFGPIVTLGAYVVQAGRWSWEGLYVSAPVAILIALVLYVNEIPDREGDATVGKRTLPVRLSKEAVVGGYAVATAVAYLLVALGAVSGLTPVPTAIALATIPAARRIHRGLRRHYDDPYALMPWMGRNVALHGVTTMLLVAGYVVAIAAGDDAPGFLR